LAWGFGCVPFSSGVNKSQSMEKPHFSPKMREMGTLRFVYWGTACLKLIKNCLRHNLRWQKARP
jgi:hypothetical protein